MAPSAILLDPRTIRVFVGGWDENGVSRIGYVDIDSADPLHVIRHSAEPVLDLGEPGTFDDNGVFPGHAAKINNRVYLYYTGYQLQTRIRFTNFGGLALSDPSDYENYRRVSRVPVHTIETKAATRYLDFVAVLESARKAGADRTSVLPPKA